MKNKNNPTGSIVGNFLFGCITFPLSVLFGCLGILVFLFLVLIAAGLLVAMIGIPIFILSLLL